MDRSGLRCASVCGSLCSGRRRDCGLTPEPRGGRAAGQERSVTVEPREPYFETVEYVSAGGDRDPTD